MPAHKTSVLHIAPTPFFADRGCHIRIEGIVRSLNKLGYANTVCTYHHGRDVDSVATLRISPIESYTQTEAGPNKFKLFADLKLLGLVLGEYRRSRPDFLHAHLHEGLFIALIVKLLFFWRRTPVIGDIQGSLSGELEAHGSFEKLPFLKWPVAAFEWLLVKSSKHLICSSSHSQQQLLNFGVHKEAVTLVPDGADAVRKHSIEEKAKIRKQLGIDSNTVLAVYSGALLEAKGLNHLKALIRAKPSSVQFLIIGYPTEDVQSFIQRNDMNDYCHVIGRVNFELLPSYLMACDIAIEPKKSQSGEGSGKILNYMACGLPVVAFDTENNREFLPDASTLAKDDSELLAIVNELAASQEYRSKVSNLNQGYFEDHHSWNKTQIVLAEVYRSLKPH